MKYDYLIVGAGLFGCTCANLLSKANKKILLIDKNTYVGGNCYTSIKDDICIHEHGPHIFHTNNSKVWEFINQFDNFVPFNLKVKVRYQDQFYSFPINLHTLNQVLGITSPLEAEKYFKQQSKIMDPKNFEEVAENAIGTELYNIFIKGYTTKQWGKSPKELPATIFKRLPIRTDFNDNYFPSERGLYQGIPSHGYTFLCEQMIKDPNITLMLNTAYPIEIKADKTIYTGKIDEYFNFKYGYLDYRSLKFEQEYFPHTFQGCAIVNYTDENIPWTRITEHKYFNLKDQKHTWITKEYPQNYTKNNDAYYPINDSINNALYLKYKLESPPNIFFGGRLGSYKYIDMDQTIEDAFKLSEELHRSQ